MLKKGGSRDLVLEVSEIEREGRNEKKGEIWEKAGAADHETGGRSLRGGDPADATWVRAKTAQKERHRSIKGGLGHAGEVAEPRWWAVSRKKSKEL